MMFCVSNPVKTLGMILYGAQSVHYVTLVSCLWGPVTANGGHFLTEISG